MSKETENKAQSMLLNTRRAFHLECITKGVPIPDLTPDDEGYVSVSFHHAGMRSAWVQQAKLRAKYPDVDTKVVNMVDMPCAWSAEIRAKRKPNEGEQP